MGASERRAQALKDIKAGAIRAGGVPQTVTPRKGAKKAAVPTGSATEVEGDGLPVEAAFLHTPVLMKGLQLQTINEAKAPGVKMVWVKNEGLVIAYNGSEGIVPAANVQFALFKTHNNGRIQAD